MDDRKIKSPNTKSQPKKTKNEKDETLQIGQPNIEEKAETVFSNRIVPYAKRLSYSEQKLKNKKNISRHPKLFHSRFMSSERHQIFEESSSQNSEYEGKNKQISNSSNFHSASLKHDKNTLNLTIISKAVEDPLSSSFDCLQKVDPFDYEKFAQKTNQNFRLIFAKLNSLQNSRSKEIEGMIEGTSMKQGRKKNRRKAADINRKYRCGLFGCNKRYGSRSSVKIHIDRMHNIPKKNIKIVNNAARIIKYQEVLEQEQDEDEVQLLADQVEEHFHSMD